jgi:hypothetical protein
VQLEAVGRVSVRDLGLQVGWQIYNIDGIERALLGADTASDTEPFGYEGNLGVGGNLNA